MVTGRYRKLGFYLDAESKMPSDSDWWREHDRFNENRDESMRRISDARRSYEKRQIDFIRRNPGALSTSNTSVPLPEEPEGTPTAQEQIAEVKETLTTQLLQSRSVPQQWATRWLAMLCNPENRTFGSMDTVLTAIGNEVDQAFQSTFNPWDISGGMTLSREAASIKQAVEFGKRVSQHVIQNYNGYFMDLELH